MPKQRTKETQDEALAKHVLVETGPGEVRAFYLKVRGEGRMMSTMIVFSAEGIVIMGDLCPKRNGVISAYGYGLDWFASSLSPAYLAEKFLEQKWFQKKAADWCRETAKELLDEKDEDGARAPKAEGRAADLEEIADRLGDMSQETFIDEVSDIGVSAAWEIGHGYDPDEVAWLTAIQKKFAEEYAKR